MENKLDRVYITKWEHKHGDDFSLHRTENGATTQANKWMLESAEGWADPDELTDYRANPELLTPDSFSELTGYNEFMTTFSLPIND